MVKNVVWEEVEGTFDQGDPLKQWFSTFGNTGLGDTPTCSKTALNQCFLTEWDRNRTLVVNIWYFHFTKICFKKVC